MATILSKTQKLSEELRNAENGSIIYIHECREFLIENLKDYIIDTIIEPSDDCIITYPEVVQKSAKRMAKCLYRAAFKRDNNLPDSKIPFETWRTHNNRQIKALGKSAEAMLKIINEGMKLPLSLNKFSTDINLWIKCGKLNCDGLKKHTIPSFTKQLKNLINELTLHTQSEKDSQKNKKGNKPLRHEIISTITHAWIDITGVKPERRQEPRDGSKPNGIFYKFMQNCLELFHTKTDPLSEKIDTQEAIRDAYKIFLKIQADESAMTILREKNNQLNKTLTYEVFEGLVYEKLQENKFLQNDFKTNDQKLIANFIKLNWDERQKYGGISDED